MIERRKIGRRLTKLHRRTIVQKVGELDPRLRPTWQHVESAALAATRHTFSRQALSRHTDVVAAYEAKLAEHHQVRQGGKVSKPKDAGDLERKIEAMQAELDALRLRVAELDVAHVNLVANAIRFGMPQHLLKQVSENPNTAKVHSSKALRVIR
jgi:hypothetical protein